MRASPPRICSPAPARSARSRSLLGPAGSAVVQIAMSARWTEPLNVFDYEALAAERLDAGAHGYYAGGAGDERRCARTSTRSSAGAAAARARRRRGLLDRDDRARPGDRAAASSSRRSRSSASRIRTASWHWREPRRRPGTIMCLSTLASATVEEVAATGCARWFQLYAFRDSGVRASSSPAGARRRLHRARAHRRHPGARPARARPAHGIHDPAEITVAELGLRRRSHPARRRS